MSDPLNIVPEVVIDTKRSKQNNLVKAKKNKSLIPGDDFNLEEKSPPT